MGFNGACFCSNASSLSNKIRPQHMHIWLRSKCKLKSTRWQSVWTVPAPTKHHRRHKSLDSNKRRDCNQLGRRKTSLLRKGLVDQKCYHRLSIPEIVATDRCRSSRIVSELIKKLRAKYTEVVLRQHKHNSWVDSMWIRTWLQMPTDPDWLLNVLVVFKEPEIQLCIMYSTFVLLEVCCKEGSQRKYTS